MFAVSIFFVLRAPIHVFFFFISNNLIYCVQQRSLLLNNNFFFCCCRFSDPSSSVPLAAPTTQVTWWPDSWYGLNQSGASIPCSTFFRRYSGTQRKEVDSRVGFNLALCLALPTLPCHQMQEKKLVTITFFLFFLITFFFTTCSRSVLASLLLAWSPRR